MNKRYLKIAGVILLAYLVIAVGFYFIGGEQLHYEDSTSGMVSASATVGEIVSGVEVRQHIAADADELLSISLKVSTFGRKNTVHLTAAIVDADGNCLYQETAATDELTDYSILTLTPAEGVVLAGKDCDLVITSPDGEPGNAVSILAGNSFSTGKTDIAQNIPERDRVRVNGERMEYKLCMRLASRHYLTFGDRFGLYASAAGVLLAAYLVYIGILLNKGKQNWVLKIIAVAKKYSFLIEQLVVRDFKTRYKRSVLGVVWSFLNPLLTMLVQYVVFSTLFKSDIQNYPLYLLTGIVVFNFYNEATFEASKSIVINTPLITKVYIPKVIYPLTSIISAGINLVISFVPLLGVMLLTGAYPRAAFALVPYGILCLVAFATGVGLFLATYTVFFKDVEFLWRILIMMWMYATPIFYPETIIPDVLMPYYQLNPLTRFVHFFRTILIEGVSPPPSAYAVCFLCGFLPLLVGLFIFRRKQDEFIYHL